MWIFKLSCEMQKIFDFHNKYNFFFFFLLKISNFIDVVILNLKITRPCIFHARYVHKSPAQNDSYNRVVGSLVKFHKLMYSLSWGLKSNKNPYRQNHGLTMGIISLPYEACSFADMVSYSNSNHYLRENLLIWYIYAIT